MKPVVTSLILLTVLPVVQATAQTAQGPAVAMQREVPAPQGARFLMSSISTGIIWSMTMSFKIFYWSNRYSIQ